MKWWLTICFLISTLAYGQCSFEVVGSNTDSINVSANGKLELADFKIRNTKNHPVILKWELIQNTLSDSWDYSMCAYGQCQVGIPNSGNIKQIDAGKTGFVALHLFPQGVPGKGVVTFNLIDTANPSCVQAVTFQVNVK